MPLMTQQEDSLTPTHEPMLTPAKEAAHLLNVSQVAFYRKVKNGELPSYRLGRKILINIDEVLAAMRR